MNRVELTGFLAQDPVLRETSPGLKVATFTLAVRRPYAKETVDFLDCVAWRSTAEFVARFHKGDLIEVVGYMATSVREREANGATLKVRRVEVVAESVDPLRTKGGGG